MQNPAGLVLECRLRGKLKDPVLTGDRVRFNRIAERQGVVEEVLPRRNQLIRPPIANVDLFLAVLSCDQPRPSLRLLDRMLALAGSVEMESLVVLNKCDLPYSAEAEIILARYPAIGYRVLAVSARDNAGIDILAGELTGRIAVMGGPSGVGKSSLLNCLAPEARARTAEISAKIGRGRHTTRHVELFPAATGGWVADTPGFSSIDAPQVEENLLDGLFPEFEGPAGNCQFGDCQHQREVSCGVKAAVERGEVLLSRYESYLHLLEEITQNRKCYR